jgi:hypothetical protein
MKSYRGLLMQHFKLMNRKDKKFERIALEVQLQQTAYNGRAGNSWNRVRKK